MKNLAIAVAAAFIFALGSCAENVGKAVHYAAKDKDMTASGNIVAKSFAVGDFEKIRAGGVFKVVYTPAEGKSKVEVRTSDNVMPFVSVGVKCGTGGDEQTYKSNGRFKQNMFFTLFVCF